MKQFAKEYPTYSRLYQSLFGSPKKRQEFQDPSSATASSAGGREATRLHWSNLELRMKFTIS